MKGKMGRPSMEDDLVQSLNWYLEAVDKVSELRKKANDAYEDWRSYGQEADEEEKRAKSHLAYVRGYKNDVERKRRRQSTSQPAAALPDNVILMEQKG